MRAVSPVMYSSKHTCISHGSMDGIAPSTGMRTAHHITRALSSERRPPQHATLYVVCHVVSSTSARSEGSVPHLACALLLTARRCVPSAVAPKDTAACAWMHRPSPPPPARANRAKKQRQHGTLPRSSHRCATSAAASSAAVATAGRSPCRDRRRGRRLAPPPHVAPWLHEPREHRRLRARQAAVAEEGSHRSCAVPWCAVSWQCRFLRRCPRA